MPQLGCGRDVNAFVLVLVLVLVLAFAFAFVFSFWGEILHDYQLCRWRAFIRGMPTLQDARAILVIV